MRICSRCGESKSLDSFPKNKNCRDGRVGCCKKCTYQNFKAYHKRHPKQRYQNIKRERSRNPEKYRHYNRIRYARRAAAKGEIVERDWRRLVVRYFGLCAYCCERLATSQDHIIPISRGGTHTIGNVLPACGSCNSKKRDHLLVEWRRKMDNDLAAEWK